MQDNPLILAQVKRIIVDTVDVDPDVVQTDAVLRRDLGADSLDSLEIVMAIEEHFGIRFTDEAAMQIRTVGDLAGYIAAARADTGSSDVPA